MANKLVILQPTPQQLVDYANALVKINNYAWAITNQNLPVLNSPPPDYGDFATEFSGAKTHALNWSQNIFVELVQFPTTLTQQAANLFNLEELFVGAYLNALIADPNDSNSKTQLGTALSTLETLIGLQVASASSAKAELEKFAVNISADATILAQISKDSLLDAGADKKAITALLTDIKNLQDEISAANTLLTVAEIGIGLSFFVGVVGVICCLIPETQAVGVGLVIGAVAGEATSIAGTVIELKRINAFQAEIDADQTQISGLRQDIILLNAVSQSFNDLYQANLQAQNALTTILNMWKSLAATVAQLNTDLATVETEVSAAKYSDALKQFQHAETAWKDVLAFAKGLGSINYSWQDTSGTWHNYGDQSPSLNAAKITVIPSKIAAAA